MLVETGTQNLPSRKLKEQIETKTILFIFLFFNHSFCESVKSIGSLSDQQKNTFLEK